DGWLAGRLTRVLRFLTDRRDGHRTVSHPTRASHPPSPTRGGRVTGASAFDIVVPTVGRSSLDRLLDALGTQPGPRPRRVFLVDDRATGDTPLAREHRDSAGDWLAERIRVVDRRAGTRG